MTVMVKQLRKGSYFYNKMEQENWIIHCQTSESKKLLGANISKQAVLIKCFKLQIDNPLATNEKTVV